MTRLLLLCRRCRWRFRLLKAAALAAKFLAKSGEPKSTPAVGEEAQSSARRTQEHKETEENATASDAAVAASSTAAGSPPTKTTSCAAASGTTSKGSTTVSNVCFSASFQDIPKLCSEASRDPGSFRAWKRKFRAFEELSGKLYIFF